MNILFISEKLIFKKLVQTSPSSNTFKTFNEKNKLRCPTTSSNRGLKNSA